MENNVIFFCESHQFNHSTISINKIIRFTTKISFFCFGYVQSSTFISKKNLPTHIDRYIRLNLCSIHTLSTCAKSPSWLLCRVVSLTSVLACEANCSNSDPCDPWRCELAEPNGGGWCEPNELPEPELEVRANTFPMCGWRLMFGLMGGACVRNVRIEYKY